jgi:hypothetical protein
MPSHHAFLHVVQSRFVTQGVGHFGPDERHFGAFGEIFRTPKLFNVE